MAARLCCANDSKAKDSIGKSRHALKIVLLKMMRTARHAKASQGKHSSKFLTAMALLFKWWRLETRRD